MEVYLGNFLDFPSESVVNFTDEKFSGFGYVDNIVQSSSGFELKEKLITSGESKINTFILTPSYQLSNYKYIIHLITPYDGTKSKIDTVRETFDILFREIIRRDIKSVTIPSIPFSCYSIIYEDFFELFINTVDKYDKDLLIKLVFKEEYSFYLFKIIKELGHNVDFIKNVLKYHREKQTITETKLSNLLEKYRAKNILVKWQNQEIRDSITYAKKIQNALLPTEIDIDKKFKDYFIFYKPKDIVSGDFYYIKKFNNKILVAIADCTGHGVPGAFMSVLGISVLSEIVSDNELDNTGNILDRLRIKIKHLLKQNQKEKGHTDGMDIALFLIDRNKSKLMYSGANNPIFIIRPVSNIDESIEKDEFSNDGFVLIELKADRQPISIYPIEKPFQTKVVKLKKGDLIYAFSDGFIDQFGGDSNKRFMSKKFKYMLLSICNSSLDTQKSHIENQLKNWKGENDQSDDILIFGCRFK